MKQEAYLGEDSINHLIPLLNKHNVNHIFLVRGKNSFITSGAEKIIKNCVSEFNCEITHFSDFSENPKIEDVNKGLDLLKRSKADCIIAIGGGSVLDMGKLIRFSHSFNGNLTGDVFIQKSDLLPLIAIPTTAGTGAEATHFAVIYKDKVKYSTEHDAILPNYSIIYPSLTYKNHRYLTACTGFDALAQAIEAFWNINATEESDEYAEKAIKLLWNNLPLLVSNPDTKLRDLVSEGSYWAGCAINITKTTAPHAFSYPFTTYYGYPHGHAIALTFPYFAYLNIVDYKNSTLSKTLDCYKYTKKMEYLMSILSIKGDNCYTVFKDYIDVLGLTTTNNDIDIRLILESVNYQRLTNNPVKIDKETLYNLEDFICF